MGMDGRDVGLDWINYGIVKMLGMEWERVGDIGRREPAWHRHHRQRSPAVS